MDSVMGAVVANALVMGGVVAFFALLRSQASRPVLRDPQTGELVLQCSSVLVWSMGSIAIGGPVAMGLLSLIIPFEHPGQVFVPIGLGAFFFLLGGVMCLWAARRRTRVSDDGLTSEYLFVGPRFLPWEEVEKISFSSGQEFWVHGPKRSRAMLHVWFVGIAEAVPLLRKYLPAEVRARDAAVLERFATAVGASTKVEQRGRTKAPPRRRPRDDD
ncbi:MAG: PH domain-containing protein [Gemmataceae bacterium]